MRTPARTRRSRVRLLAVLAVAVVALAGCSGEQSMLDPQGPFAREPDGLFNIVMLIALVVFIFVQGLIIYSVVRFRRREGDDEVPEQVHGNTRLEILWTVIPAVILAALAVPTVQLIFELDAEPDDALTVEVIGHRWWWEFRYPDYGIITANELVMPVDRPVRLEMRAEEAGSPDRGVIHSFWLPALAGKQDVVPGRITTLNILAEEPGRYLGQCAEYCGLSHANMRNRGVAMEPADFEDWVAEQQSPAPVPEEGTLEARGAELFGALGDGRQSCVQCHAIRTEAVTGPIASEDFTPATGPNLTHLMSRREFAGAIFDLYLPADDDDPSMGFTDTVNEEQLKAWLRNAPAEKAMRPEDGIGMPALELTEDEIDALYAYLVTLE